MTVTWKSKHAYPQLYYILTHTEFTQRKMARDLKVHHGRRISDFVSLLEEREYVKRTLSTTKRGKTYEVVSPIGLIRYYSNFRRMENLLLESRELGNNRNEMMQYLNSKGAIFCLATALEFHDEYYRDPAIYAYMPDKSFLENELPDQAKGKVKVFLYGYDVADEIEIKNKIRITPIVRTIIDLFCDNKAYAAEPLIRRMWGNE